MHHYPAGPPLPARLSGTLTRGLVRTRRTRRHIARISLGVALSTAVTGFVLAVPVVSSSAPTSTSLDSSSNSAARHADESSPVVMGRDGAAAPSRAADTPVVPPATEVPAPEPEVPASPEAPAPERAPEVPATSEEPAPAPEATTESTTEASTTEPSTQATAAASSAGAPAPAAEAELIALVNDVRAGAGCGPVEHDEGLAKVARAHSADMRDRNFFDHTNLDGRDPFDRATAAGQTNARAENIASGQADPAGVMDDWMDSSGHRANILNCELRALGVGIAEGPDGPFWTQLFGD